MVDTKKQALIGCQSLDIFKFWHKNALPRDFYALDIDLVLIEKQSANAGGISAVFDFKVRSGGDTIQFTEAMKYKFYLDCGISVWVVRADVDCEKNDLIFPLLVEEIASVPDWKVPLVEFGAKYQIKNAAMFERFESWLRGNRTVNVPR
jgi:hypothetical protein